MRRMYSIFLQNKCILTGLTEEKFKQSWETLNNLVGIITTNYTAEDLSYEFDKEFSQFPKVEDRTDVRGGRYGR